MTVRGAVALLVALSLGACAVHASAPPAATAAAPKSAPERRGAPRDDRAALREVAAILDAKYIDPGELAALRFPALVAEADAALARNPEPDAARAVLASLVAHLHRSHTEYVPRSSPEYYELASTFEPVFADAPEQCDRRYLPSFPIEWTDIGVLWKEDAGRWFVIGVFDDGPAKKAGLLAGDEVVRADGAPFAPVASFAGAAGHAVTLGVRRTKDGALLSVPVVPRRAKPREAFKSAIAASARVIARGKARIGYVRVWSWAGDDMQDEVTGAVARFAEQKVDGVIVDVRDGWGGAAPGYLDVFNRNVPVLESRTREGKVYRVDAKIRVPAVLLVNGGSRSGKETIAFGAKKYRLARLVGERTAGAFSAGAPYCLSNGDLLYVARASVTVDGEALEGKGVAPDVTVPFDVRYAEGRDPQLDAALDALASPGGAGG